MKSKIRLIFLKIGCVTATTLGSLHNNFHTTIVKEAVASSSDKKRLIALNTLRSNKVKVIHSFQLVAIILKVRNSFHLRIY